MGRNEVGYRILCVLILSAVVLLVVQQRISLVEKQTRLARLIDDRSNLEDVRNRMRAELSSMCSPVNLLARARQMGMEFVYPSPPSSGTAGVAMGDVGGRQ